ncbi:hypothetical protein [Streptomyces sp. NWU339]|uniref:hypothetical protein n=1 Tax=Streptomyces sp. NWU339 TaxID=2185284 RepID=UPI0011B64665|nr:hypothetical protein [Streptomyces sp. NWU339]
MNNDVTNATQGVSVQADGSNDSAPPPPGWLRRAAERVRTALVDTRGLVLMLVADLVTVLGAGAVWLALGGDPAVVGVAAGALLAFGAAMLPLIGRRNADGEPPLWPPFVLVVIPLAVLAVGLPAWGTWAFLESRHVDVTHRVEFALDPPLVDGETAVASVHTDDPRPRLSITFALVQHDPAAPMCAPGSELTVTLKSSAGKNQARTGAAGTEFAFALGPGATDIELSVRLHAEQGCELDLSVASAQLDD